MSRRFSDRSNWATDRSSAQQIATCSSVAVHTVFPRIGLSSGFCSEIPVDRINFWSKVIRFRETGEFCTN